MKVPVVCQSGWFRSASTARRLGTHAATAPDDGKHPYSFVVAYVYSVNTSCEGGHLYPDGTISFAMAAPLQNHWLG